MAINKGLKSLVESSPNFSNQGLENAVNELKNISGGFITKTFEVDKAIEDNTVLTTSQKNDVKETINTRPYLNFGRYLNDVIRHTSTILDGTIIPGAEGVEEDTQGSFLEILQTVQSIQITIPELYGVPASEKSRDVNDHLGSLNNKFSETEDSSKPVFTSLKDTITILNGININAIGTDLPNTLTDLKNFLASVVADSTDFQQTLDNFADEVKSDFEYIDLTLGMADPFGNYQSRNTRSQLLADRDEIVTQVNLENSNLSGIRTYIETLTNNMSYTGLAEDPQLRKLMSRVSQNTDWQTYFNDYETNSANLNPLYTTNTDSDKVSIIEQVLIARGLPDVVDYVDLESVANKAKKDSRIDTKGFDLKTAEQIITECCTQLNITTTNNSIYSQSKLLLNSLNNYDRQQTANALDLHESSNTLS